MVSNIAQSTADIIYRTAKRSGLPPREILTHQLCY